MILGTYLSHLMRIWQNKDNIKLLGQVGELSINIVRYGERIHSQEHKTSENASRSLLQLPNRLIWERKKNTVSLIGEVMYHKLKYFLKHLANFNIVCTSSQRR